ncbi:MAG: HAD-IA family hydrolase [Pseudomonadota bacterium]
MSDWAVVFDLDGTLIDSLPDIAYAANSVLQDEGLSALPEEIVGTFVGLGEEVFVDRLIATTSLDPKDRDRVLAGFMAHYEKATDRTRLMPGAEAALGALARRGFRIGLCTNKPTRPLNAVLAALGIADHFGSIVAGDRLPVRKPDPAPLSLCLSELGARRCVFVGDGEADAAVARAAGVPFVRFFGGTPHGPAAEITGDASFSDYRHLEGIVDALTDGEA